MNDSTSSAQSQYDTWARRQLADYDARRPGTMFGEGVVLDLAQGYRLQAAVVNLRRQRGERVVGYKVGCTSQKIRTQLGINHCVTGRLFASELYSSGTRLPRQEFANLAIEGELAAELARSPETKDFSDHEIPACVARIFPVIELHHRVMRGEQPSAGELVANNAIHAGFVAGEGISDRELRETDLRTQALSIFADDQLVEACAGPDLIQTLNSSLRWLTKIVHDRGEQLEPGQIVLTGSIPSLISIGTACRIQVEAPPFGNVAATFSDDEGPIVR